MGIVSAFCWQVQKAVGFYGLGFYQNFLEKVLVANGIYTYMVVETLGVDAFTGRHVIKMRSNMEP